MTPTAAADGRDPGAGSLLAARLARLRPTRWSQRHGMGCCQAAPPSAEVRCADLRDVDGAARHIRSSVRTLRIDRMARPAPLTFSRPVSASVRRGHRYRS
jgi:hypothetical protein